MGLALIKFPNGFDTDMAYQLRERDLATLEDVQKIAVNVEENLLAKRAKARAEKKVTIKEESYALDQVLRKVEQILDRMKLEKSEPQIRNPNFHG